MVIFQFAFCRFTRGYTHHIPMVFPDFPQTALEKMSRSHWAAPQYFIMAGAGGPWEAWCQMSWVKGQVIGVAQVIWFFYLVGGDWNNNSDFPI